MIHEKEYRGENFLDKLEKFGIITICGAGALGSNLVDTLVRQGFQKLRVIDFDRVEEHNVNTQCYAKTEVGMKKVAALSNRMFDVASVDITTVDRRLENSNIKKYLKDSALVVDTFDNNASRQMVQDYVRQQKVLCLHAGMFEGYGEIVWDKNYRVPKDVVGVDVCEYPLARNLVTLVVSIMAEEIQNCCLADKPRFKDWKLMIGDNHIYLGEYNAR